MASPLIFNDDPSLSHPWDEAPSTPSSRCGSQQSDSAQDFLTAPPARQRTTQACDKCRDRKTKCSGDHPICKRCTSRGLICHYSGRERIRGPTKARLRHATSLDLRFGSMFGEPTTVKQEDFGYAPFQHPGFNHAASLYQDQTHLALPEHPFGTHSQPCSPAQVPPLPPRMSLPHVIVPDQFYAPMPVHSQQHHVRRVQSQSAIMPRGPSYNHASSSPEGSPVAHRRVSSVVEFGMLMPPNKFPHHFQDDGGSGSEPQSATSSVFDAENMSYSSESSGSTFPNPLSRSASEFDLRVVDHGHGNMPPRYRHHTLPVLDTTADIIHPHPHVHSPATSIHSLTDLSSPGIHPVEIAVPQIKGSFGDPWAQSAPHEQQQVGGGGGVFVREVELMYPSPVTPINLSSEGDGEGGFYEYMLAAPRASLSPPSVKEERRETAPAAFQLLSSPLSEGTLIQS